MIFIDDDVGYLDWLKNYPTGLVANSRKEFDPEYVVLHQASCKSINRYPNMLENPGGFTARSYIKICGLSETELASRLKKIAPAFSTWSKKCGICFRR